MNKTQIHNLLCKLDFLQYQKELLFSNAIRVLHPQQSAHLLSAVESSGFSEQEKNQMRRAIEFVSYRDYDELINAINDVRQEIELAEKVH